MIHPAIRDLFSGLGRHPAFQELLQRLPLKQQPLSLSGLTTTAKALYSVLLWQLTERPLIVVAAGNKQAESLREAMQTFYHLLVPGRERLEPQLLPALDVVPQQRMSPHAEILEERATGLWRLATGAASITVTPLASALLRTEPREFYRQLALTLRTGEEIPLDDLLAHLESIGYEKRDPVEMVGEYSVRGGILDVYSPEAPKPVRLEMFGDQIESMRRFEVESQRSVLKIPDCTLLPLTEFQKSRATLAELIDHLQEAGVPARELPLPGEAFPGYELLLPLVRPRNASVFDLLENPIVILDEPEEIRASADRFWKRLEDPERPALSPPDKVFYRWEDLVHRNPAQVELRELEIASPFTAEPQQPAGNADGERGRGGEGEKDRRGDAATRRHGENPAPIPQPPSPTPEQPAPEPNPKSQIPNPGWLSPSLSLHIPTRPSMAFHGNMQVAIAEARSLVESGSRVAFFAASTGELERLADILNEYGIPYQLGTDQSETTPQYLAERAYMAGSVASVYLIRGGIERGTILPDSKLAIFGSEDLFETPELVARGAGAKSHLATFSAETFELKPGDYVVHAEHGVGRFVSLRSIEQGEAKGDYMLLEYAGASKLYVPLTHMDQVQRFRGAGDAAPQLDRMGGATWTRTKTRVKAKMRDMAEELLKLYASRKLAPGFAFSSDSNWQREFEDAFEFTETRDQRSAIADIKRDMETPEPMDRLLCGDVGYGKTEVVMRAAFKALGDGKQVVLLAPTTVLVFQHYETFKRRFQPFPVRVEMLSRFVPPKERKQVVADIAEGKVDIAIGTHRLLSKDVEFKDLGLVIVDEEQRFGVRHKERLKQIRKSVDVIAMSATPIPRTLHMSLLGLRDMSVIETPPKDRLAIQTVVAPMQPDLIRSALELELNRGGQVYFVHNRIDSIWARAAMIQELVPQARIGVGHGQLNEDELERTMLRFMQHEYDILVCTTIVENGLDIPLANTMIIENADKYGLSELYQLRGRVGRSNRRAYAYLLIHPDTELSEIARKRLAALKEFSDLGAGFKIAALDLELRGGGNLLGGEQHGHINSVGFDMYVRMLEETVRELKGEEVPPEIHASLNLALDIRIPPAYIVDENQRLRAYRRIAATHGAEERDRIAKELEDRYGPVPEAVQNLLDYASLKSVAEKLGIERIDRRQGALQIKFHQQTRVDPTRLMNLVSRMRGAQ
ncbi:MAG: transcription-repair coupling factor, partial [Bryobacterales bacterium]|nr:transcription-repair coupling factor [Bryobacterales bacterium]